MKQNKFIRPHLPLVTLGMFALSFSFLSAQNEEDQLDAYHRHAERLGYDPLGQNSIPSNLPKQVITQIEYIELPHKSMTKLLYGANMLKTGNQHRKELQALIKKGDAEVVETSLILSRPGETARIESVRQMIYPTEYDAPVVIPPKGNKDGTKTEAITTPPMPAAFEERPVGFVMEIVPIIGAGSDAQIISLDIEAEDVSYVGKHDWATWKDQRGEANITMLNFYKLSIKTGITLKSGSYELLGCHSPKNDEGQVDHSRKLLIFVRSVIKVPGN